MRVIQFAKWPEYGNVKTRLAKVVGVDEALKAHLVLTEHVLARLLASGSQLELWWDRPRPSVLPDEARGLLRKIQISGVQQGYQSGGDLGARMHQALEAGLRRDACVVIVGSDCPAVDGDYLEQARVALETRDVVLGPADDGGYVLIGARCTVPAMLAGVAWGTDQALVQTCEQLQRVGLSWTCLPPSWDVDEVEDWHRFQARYQS